MVVSKRIRIVFFSLGLLLLLLSAQGSFVSAQTQIPPTPTIDRLAKPTLPAQPDMADIGAQDYWLYCSPCHGDKAQGLTEDFRRQYPPEHQNCWESGCHGKLPYVNGWTIPQYVPALVGPDTLQKFPTALNLKLYTQLKMPYQTPGILEDEIYWRLTAFLLKQNGLWDGQGELNDQTASMVIINPMLMATSTPLPTPTSTLPPTYTPTPTPVEIADAVEANSIRLLGLGAFVALLIGGVFLSRVYLKK